MNEIVFSSGSIRKKECENGTPGRKTRVPHSFTTSNQRTFGDIFGTSGDVNCEDGFSDVPEVDYEANRASAKVESFDAQCGEEEHTTSTPPSLDIYGRKSPRVGAWDRKRRRAYQRIRSGLTKHSGERLRFMTLTSSDRVDRPLNDSFEVLKKRIMRTSPMQLYAQGYLTRGEVRKFYQGKQWATKLRMDYFKVETREGNGVLHILYFGDFIPQAWLSDMWSEIHESPVVDIRATKKGVSTPKRLTKYVLTQYVNNQDAVVRYSWSRGWVFKGFVNVWRYLVRDFGVKRAIRVWEYYLTRGWMFFDMPVRPFDKDPPCHWCAGDGFFNVRGVEDERRNRC